MDPAGILRSQAPPEHLVKHDAPQVLTEKPNMAKAGMSKGKCAPLPEQPDQLNYFLPVLPKLERRENHKTNVSSADPILDYILPPREWFGNGNQYIQKISRTPASRMDVINLQERLDARLEHLQARETGICPIRRDLYSQTFDELIRQITLDSPDRGLMFLRVRDEIRMTMAAYETLFDRGVAYGTRNALTFEQEKEGSEDKVKDIEEANMELERQINEWKLKCELLERKHTEVRELDDKKHMEEIKAEKRPGIWLKNILDAIMNHTRADYFTAGGETKASVPQTEDAKVAPEAAEEEKHSVVDNLETEPGKEKASLKSGTEPSKEKSSIRPSLDPAKEKTSLKSSDPAKEKTSLKSGAEPAKEKSSIKPSLEPAKEKASLKSSEPQKAEKTSLKSSDPAKEKTSLKTGETEPAKEKASLKG